MKIKSIVVTAVLVTAVLCFGVGVNAQTTSVQALIAQLQTQIASLMAQIQALQAQQSSTTTTTSSTTNTTTPTPFSTPPSTAVLSAPIPPNSKCFWQANGNLPECANFYLSNGQMACPLFYNPVYDANGTFYPSACWAEQLGVKAGSYNYGYSSQFIKFIQSLWQSQGYNVPKPDMEFSYNGSGIAGWKSGVFFRSTLWTSTSTFLTLDYNISTDMGAQLTPTLQQSTTMIPAVGTKPKVLLAFVMFDNAYPEQTLIDWTSKYQGYMNDYISKKENIPNPIQYQLVPVVINPPANVARPSSSHIYFSQDEMKAVYDAATQKLGQNNFQIFTLTPVFLNGFGGYYSSYNNMEFIEASLHPTNNYSDTDIKSGLGALSAFQSMFLTISHEVLHAVGLSGDHFPMGYGTTFLDAVGLNVNQTTGKGAIYTDTPQQDCDFFGTSPDYYAVALPTNMQIKVGQEPTWLTKINSSSGNCLAGVDGNVYLKDANKDGVYEIMYKNNLIGKELQRTLGWVDIDGDGTAELVDATPYGGYNKIGASACNSNTDCGTNGFTGLPTCQGNSVYQNYITYTCNNPGQTNASCTKSTSVKLQNNCTGNTPVCSNGQCVASTACSCATWGNWGSCINGYQTKTCTVASSNNCGQQSISQPCSPTCVPSWACTSWSALSACVNGYQTKTCLKQIDQNNCGIPSSGQQSISQPCTTCSPNWQCASWSTCINGQQTRTCTDLNNCGTTAYQPITTQTCQASTQPVLNVRSAPASLKVGETGTWQIGINYPANTMDKLSFYAVWSDETTPLPVPVYVGPNNTSGADDAAKFYHSYSKAGAYNPIFTAVNPSNQSGFAAAPLNVTNCVPSIACTSWSDWSVCTNGYQTQMCLTQVDQNNCGPVSGQQAVSQPCTTSLNYSQNQLASIADAISSLITQIKLMLQK